MSPAGFQRLSGAAARRPLLTVAVVLALAIAGGVLALGLRPSAATDTFVSASSPAYRATVQDQRHFGDDAVVVLVREPLSTLLASRNLTALTELEACLAGQYVTLSPTLHAEVPVASGSHAAYGGPTSPCGELMRHRSAQVVYGPGTFLNRAVAAVNGQINSTVSAARTAGNRAAAAADRLALARGLSPARARALATAARRAEDIEQLQHLEQLATGSGLTGVPSISDSAFVRQIVFGAGTDATATTPQSRFAYLFPNRDSALIQVRLRASLSAAQQAQAIDWIRRAVRMPMFAPPAGASFTVSGVPVVINDLAGQITGAIGELLVAALLVMAAALLLVFRQRMRLLPLAVALVASGITFGLLAAFGVALTLASIAVLPILIGLAVDYGIQFQSRAQEARAAADAAAAGSGTTLSAREAVAHATGAAAPTIATAALATATGFLVLLLSPVPMVRGFGLLLVVGIAVALGCALTAGSAALVLGDCDRDRGSRGDAVAVPGSGPVGASLRGAWEILAPPLRGAGELLRVVLHGAGELLGAALRGAGELLRPSLRGAGELLRLTPGDGPERRPVGERVLGVVVRHPGRVLALAAVLAIGGWVVDGRTPVQSDVTKLVPQSTPAMRDLRALEATTGVSGEIDVAVRGPDVATPATVRWMSAYESTVLRRFGAGASGSCARATLCPALSLPDLFATAGSGSSTTLTQAQINELLAAVPSYFSSAVLTRDRREATLAFGIRLMPLARQQRVIDAMRAALHPPPGVSAALTGLPVLAAQANASLTSPGRRLLTVLAGLLAVGLVLLIVMRRPARALIPMVPIVFATGWSALVLYLVGIALNPMSATLGTLVIAISTEFSVLLSERFAQERAAGHPPAVALARTYRSTGMAVIASGITAIVGFGVLVLSDITMLRDFGLVTLIDLTVSLAGVLLVLPAVLVARPRDDARIAIGRLRGVGRARRGRRARTRIA